MSKDLLSTNIQLREYTQYGPIGQALEEKLREAFLGLPSQKVTKAPLPADGPYTTHLDKDNQMHGITSPHMDVMPKKVEKHLENQADPFVWLQLLLEQKGVMMETSRGPLEISGFIMSLLTPDNKILLLADNEPGMPAATNAAGEETHPVLRHPIQAGIPKYQDVMQGKDIKDPVLKKIADAGILTLERLSSPWSLGYHDPTRMKGRNMVKTERLTEAEVKKLTEALNLVALTAREFRILVEVGDYVAPHTIHNALMATLLRGI